VEGYLKKNKRERTDKSFLVPVKEIRDNKYDLSINRYKEVVYDEKEYQKPTEVIKEIEQIDTERKMLLQELKKLLNVGLLDENVMMAAEDEAPYLSSKNGKR